jgi:hypothetical protein
MFGGVGVEAHDDDAIPRVDKFVSVLHYGGSAPSLARTEKRAALASAELNFVVLDFGTDQIGLHYFSFLSAACS